MPDLEWGTIVLPPNTYLQLPVHKSCPGCGKVLVDIFIYTPKADSKGQLLTADIVGYRQQAHACGP